VRKIKITTPENIEIEYNLADIGSRTAAYIIDSLVQALFLLVLIIGILLIRYFSPDLWEDYYGWIIGISMILSFMIICGYFISMELTNNGQTFGKKVMRLRAIRNNGQSLTLKHSAIRNLFKIFLDIIGVGPLFIFFNKEHKRIGDMAASTIVIIENEKSRPITLDDLQKSNEHFDYYICKEERELLRDYLERKNKMEDYSRLQQELKSHFRKKFDSLGILDEWENFINTL
jgi:uncharacterized RDD family membrane protein YckC